jgi:hypothetical protein
MKAQSLFRSWCIAGAGVAIFIACTPPQNQPEETILIDPNEIRMGGIVHDTLSHGQLQKIGYIHSTFEEVYPITLEETITNFRRDLNVDDEMDVWMMMAQTYNAYVEGKPDLDLNTKMEVYKLVLSRSMMPSAEAVKNVELKNLSEEEALQMLSLYGREAKPINVVRQ